MSLPENARWPAVLIALTLAGCKGSWFEERRRTTAASTITGETFALYDDSSATPTRGRPHAKRKATVRVSLPATPAAAASASLTLDVETAVERRDARMKLVLTDPDGTAHEGPKSVTSRLVFCEKPQQACEAVFQLLMTYDGVGGA